MGLQESIAAVEGCSSMRELVQSLNGIIQNYGFSSFAFIDAGRPELDIPYYTGTFSAAWESTYIQNDFVQVDPAIARVRRTNVPFSWGDLNLREKVTRKSPPEVKMMDAAREFGFKEGFVVPFHYRDRLGALHSSSTVFFWEDKPNTFYKLFDHHKIELHLIMIYWVQRAIDIVRLDRAAPAFFRASADEEPVNLTWREREVMSWSARGKTSADTSEILKISKATVDQHVKEAMKKLGASNKTHAVAKCIALGLIDV